MYNLPRNYTGMRSPQQTSLGMDERWERVLCYVGIWVSGIIMLLVERKNETVQRHAKQSILVFGVLNILWWVVRLFSGLLGHIPLLGWVFGFGFGLAGGIIALVMFVAWIVLMLMAFASPHTLFVGPRHSRYM